MSQHSPKNFLIIVALDMRGRIVVRADAGRGRGGYYPLRVPASSVTMPSVEALMSFFYGRGFRHFYLADLNAIQKRPKGCHLGHVLSLARQFTDCELWLDEGFCSSRDAISYLRQKNIHIIAASETLASIADFMRLRRLFRHRLIVSLDYGKYGRLQGLHSLARGSCLWWGCRVIVMSLGLIGTKKGIAHFSASSSASAAVRKLSLRGRDVVVIQGGGVRHEQDKTQLQNYGVAGALQASALYDEYLGISR